MNPDGIRIQPYYAGEDTIFGLEGYRNAFHPNPEIPGLSPRIWANVGTFDVEDEIVSNREILNALMNGVDGILLKISASVDWATLLKDVGIPYIKVYLEPGGSALEVWESFKTWIQATGIKPTELHGGIIWDGFVQGLQFPLEKEDFYAKAASLLASAKVYPDFQPLAIRFSHYHQTGATAVQELAYGFAALVELVDGLEKHGILPADLFSNCLVCTEAGADFFGEIAKIKSARVMFHQLSTLYGVSIEPEMVEIFVGTSNWTKSTWDVNTNLLRNTSEGMAAIFGGCNALAVGTHDFSGAEFSTRMARNVSNILKEESFLDKVVDPAAGSYYLEVLVSEILEKAKSKLIDIEKIGGWWQAFESGQMQNEIRGAREKSMVAVLVGKSPKIGTNKFAPNESRPHVALPEEEFWQLLPWRETLLFEHQNQNPA
jgi:methylmalonyl-CoA mutase